MEKTWTIVKFNGTSNERDSVAAVPTIWIDGEFAFWPNLPADKLRVAVRNQKIDKSWPKYKVSVFRNATYGKLQLKPLNPGIY